jgi:hypothetical protein
MWPRKGAQKVFSFVTMTMPIMGLMYNPNSAENTQLPETVTPITMNQACRPEKQKRKAKRD